MTTNINKLREEWMAFVETLPSRVGETPKEAVADLWLAKMEQPIRETEKDIEKRLADMYKQGKAEGRYEVLAELEHDKKKLLDGFAHPKDCPLCAPKEDIEAKEN
jgi:hypothetical protein